MTAAAPGDSPSNRFLSERAAALWLSGIKEMAMRSASIDNVASLAWGVPSFPTPDYIKTAVIAQLERDNDIGKYTLPDGLSDLKSLAALKHERDTGIAVDADERILVTAGNMQGMFALLHLITNPGDEIIVTDPCFASHIQQISICGGRPVYWRLDEANAWRLDVDAFSKLVSQRTKAVIINSPSNPTGKIFSRENLLRIGDIARAHDFMVLIDDPYSHFLYENTDRYFNLASVAELSDNVAYLFSFSKAYAMSGWRLGYTVLPAGLKRQLIKVHDMNMICAPRVSQAAGIAALSGDDQHLAEYRSAFSRRRELICQRLDALAHVFSYNKPEGAYYVFPKILADHADSREFCLALLNKTGVALAPGSAFGPSGEHHVRMAYCVPDETIEQAFDRMEAHFGKA
jgi:aminotransferase